MKYQLILLNFLICTFCFAQSDTIKSIYKDLAVKKFYSVNTSTESVNGAVVYKAAGKAVDKTIYDKYQSTRKNIETCKPCILETPNENDVLQNRVIKYLDCPVGYWINYYPDGKIRTIGHYRENDSDTWDPLWDAGYCIKHGTWTEYDEKGKVIKAERYDFGNLKE